LSVGAVFDDADGKSACACADEEAIAGDLCLEHHFRWQQLAEGGGGFGALCEIVLHHREADAEDAEAWIHHAEAVETFQQFWD